MTRTRTIRAGVLVCLLVVSGVAGTAGALEPSGATPHPHTPVSTTDYSVSFFVESGDSVVDAGDGNDTLASVTLDFAAERGFDGSVGNASVANTTVRVAGTAANVSNVTVSDDGARARIDLETPVNASAGDRVLVVLRDGLSPSLPEYADRERMVVGVSVADPDGNVDSTRVEYSVIEAHATPTSGVVAAFETPQRLHVRGTLPNRGYVVVRRATAGGAGEIVGVSEYAAPSHFARDLTVELDEPLDGDTRLQLSLFRETTGNDEYDPGADEPYRNAGTAPRRTVSVAVPDTDAFARGGTVWAGQTLLYVGQSNMPYALHRVTDDGDVGASVARLTATADGAVTVDTADLTVGGTYVLVNRFDGDVVDLDDDGRARVSDDTVTVAAQTLSASAAEGTLTLDSERGDYVARVSVDGADEATARALLGDHAVTVAGDGEGVAVRVSADGRVALNTSAAAPGTYGLSVAVPDTGAEAATTLTVADEATATPTTTTTDGVTATADASDGDDEDDVGTPVTAPLGPAVALVALVGAALLFVRGRR